MPKISILIPVFNEEENIHAIIKSVHAAVDSVCDVDFNIFFVDDGSSDATLPVIMSICAVEKNISYISFSRNFGKDNAIIAGLNSIVADAVITIDADLQHPPSLIPEFVKWWRQGFDVVYAFRKDKNMHASVFTRIRSKLFYKAISAFSDVQMENGISDFKLLDKKVVDVINQLPEDRPFLRGLIKWIGFKQKAVEYTPMGRHAGTTKYSLSSLIKLATHGLTSFSTKPLTFAIFLGFFFAASSLLYIPYVFISLHYHLQRPGWASVIVTIAFFGGLQLMIMGIIGLYLGKTFLQSKNRPRYIIQSSNIEVKKTPVHKPFMEDEYWETSSL
jgi:polyisoprenyl-phosphate glycosyltransferase